MGISKQKGIRFERNYMSQFAIRTEKIGKTFADGTVGIKEITTEFEQGKFYAIMGHSGSGKSTLLNILGLLDKPTEGKIYIEDKEVPVFRTDLRADIRRDKLGFIFQKFYLHPNLKVLDNVMMPMLLKKGTRLEEGKKKTMELLERFGVDRYAEKYPDLLSGGEQQRVCIARALANDPQIILGDEPTGNLDEANERYVFEYLRILSEEGKTVIIVSHNPIILEYADESARMYSGRLQLK